jgi:hypothetical protein
VFGELGGALRSDGETAFKNEEMNRLKAEVDLLSYECRISRYPVFVSAADMNLINVVLWRLVSFCFQSSLCVRDIPLAPVGLGVSAACGNICHLLLFVLAVCMFTECWPVFISYSKRIPTFYNVVFADCGNTTFRGVLSDVQENCTFL